MAKLTRRIVLGLAAVSLAGTATAQNTNVAAATYVVNALQEATNTMDGRGWIIRQGFIGHVDAGSTYNHPIRTDRATRFEVKGYCDQDCTDMDLELVASDGQVLIADTAVDDTPELRFTAAQVAGRNVSVRVRMYNCHTNICYYSVGLFSR